jgi:hypothetical protein
MGSEVLAPPSQSRKSFLVLFFKKEHLLLLNRLCLRGWGAS